ncbi:MAG: TRAM domain-containing protein [Armatimonadetes bacterium]|nr:TRAM domain-containing protein [Armatimonadota bacterium]
MIIGAFALAGATVSVTALPNLLDFIFDSVTAVNYPSKPPDASTPTSTQIFTYQKITFTDESRETSEKRAQRAVKDAETGKKSFDQLCSSDAPGVHCEDVQISSVQVRRVSEDLVKLTKPGEAQIVPDPGDPDKSQLYVLKNIGSKPDPVTTVETPRGYPGSKQPLVLLALAILGAMLGGGAGNLAVNTAEGLGVRWRKMETGDRVNLFLGIVVGIIGSLPFLIALVNLGPLVASLLTLALTIGFSLLSIFALNSMEEVLPWKRGEIRGKRSGIKVLDTNVLIDGRIYDLVRTGFLEGEIHVPKFVLKELQHIADSADPLRRQRGRRGLDVLRHLQTDHTLLIGEHDRLAPDDGEDVDSRLVRLAKALGADLVSNDYNLNRVASIQDVRVLNINDLALSLRPHVLPGEDLELTIVREGSQPGQGVGYLDDGTMVVVENARQMIGEHVEVAVTQVIQTERGKMIFGTVVEDVDVRPSTGPRPTK